MKKLSCWTIGILTLSLLSACALQPSPASVRQGNTYTQLSQAITLGKPIAKDRKITVQVINTSKQKQFANLLKMQLEGQLHARGFRILPNERGSDYVLRTKLLRAGIMSRDAAQDILLQGYGGQISPAGKLALKKANYDSVAVKSLPVYGAVIDLAIFQNPSANVMNNEHSVKPDAGWYKYKTRLVSVYSRDLMPKHFIGVAPQLAKAAAHVVSVMF